MRYEEFSPSYFHDTHRGIQVQGYLYAQRFTFMKGNSITGRDRGQLENMWLAHALIFRPQSPKALPRTPHFFLGYLSPAQFGNQI